MLSVQPNYINKIRRNTQIDRPILKGNWQNTILVILNDWGLRVSYSFNLKKTRKFIQLHVFLIVQIALSVWIRI